MIADLHTHILPDVDDGSGSVAESLKMLRRIANQGIRQVAATPHFYPHKDDPQRFLQRRQKAWERLQEAMAGEEGLPEVILGAEVYFFHGMSESESLSQLTTGKKSCILLEMPQSPWSQQMYRELEGIYVKQGLTPVIAHVDRYIHPLRTHRIPQTLSRLPVLVQANASFFLEKRTRKMALRMLENDQVQLLGSDCHNMTDRAPNLGFAMEVIRESLGDGMLFSIRDYENRIL